MKPTLNKTLLSALLAACATLSAQASYDGGRISNREDFSPGAPLYTGDINIRYSDDVGNTVAGGIEFTGSANSGKSVTLEGNINISAGEAYKDDIENYNRNSGVWLGYSDEIETGKSALDYDHISGSSITLKTVGNDDQISIDVYGYASRGVCIESCGMNADLSTITLDASSSSKDIVINSHNTAGGYGIHAKGRVAVNVIGNLAVNVAQGLGIDATGASDVGLTPTGTEQIRIAGTSAISIGGDTSHAVRSANGASLHFLDKVAINIVSGSSNTNGVTATNTGAVLMMNGLSVNADSSAVGTRAIASYTNSSIEISGETAINAMGGNSYGIYSTSGGRVTINDGLTIESGRYGIAAYEGSTVILKKAADITTYGVRATTAGSDGTIISNGAGTQVFLSGGRFDNRTSDTTLSWVTMYAYNGGTISDLDSTANRYHIIGNIRASGDGSAINLNMTSRSVFTGYTALQGTGTKTIDLSFEGNSLWQVSDNSTLTSLTLDGTSWLAFNLLDAGAMTFANITATSIALADGVVLQLLGVKSTDFDTMGRSLNTFRASLLNADTLLISGVKLVTEDNYELIHTNNNDGTFTITGITNGQLFIPEPATATLGLLGLISLMLLRRRV